MTRLFGAAVIVALAVLLTATAGAQRATQLRTQCGVASTPLAFGNYSVFSQQAADSSAEVRVTCNAAQTVKITIDQGLHGSYLQRGMTRPGSNERLNYQVFTDSTRSITWGNGTAGTQFVTGRIGATRVIFTLYARMPPGQFVRAGAYSDQLTVVIAF